MRHLGPVVLLLAVGCASTRGGADATRAGERPDPGLPVLSIQWKRAVADTRRDSAPQEFASPAVYTASRLSEDRLYVGTRTGWFYALHAKSGEVIWKRRLGSVGSRPLLDRGAIYVGTSDGLVICLDLAGSEKWRYETEGPILQPPVLADDVILVANEADQVYSLDRRTGKFRWQYESEAPEEFTLRGHSGIAVDDELAFVGFANGTLVALRTATGSVAWLSTLKGQGERFVDVDTTPIVVEDMVVSASATGGLFALDKTTGRILWRLPVEGGGGVVADDKRLYFMAANKGAFALDHAGNVLWRVGTQGGGEPAPPLLHGDFLFFALADDGLFVADKESGHIVQYFDPGFGVSSTPTLARQRLYLLSNTATLYAMGLEDLGS